MSNSIYSKRVDEVLERIPKEMSTIHGEVVELHEKAIIELACDLVTAEMDKEEKDKARKFYYANKGNNPLNILIAEELGEFYFYFYEVAKDLEPQYLFRFIYLATYMTDKGYLSTTGYKSNNIIRENQLKAVLKVSINEVTNTKKALIEHKLIEVEKDGSIKIRPSIAKRGKITGIKKEDFSRMFIDGIRELYENSKAIEHKKLGLLIKMLPYINYHHNVLCTLDTVGEKEINRVTVLGYKEIAEMLGYSERQYRRLTNDLISIKVKNMCVMLLANRGGKVTFSVNPLVYYKGTNIDDLKALINLFKM